jgi:hypothetical protein
VQKANEQKAKVLYDAIANSNGECSCQGTSDWVFRLD